MLHSSAELEGFKIGATDGEVGKIRDFYFDDHSWVIRYLVVNTGAWLADRQVLISPFAIGEPDWEQNVLPVSITRQQVKDSPSIDTDKPVSRQHEVGYLGYYGYPLYWGGSGMWGGYGYPGAMMTGLGYGGTDAQYRRTEADTARRSYEEDIVRREQQDPHLRSCSEVARYHIHASDGEIGHVDGFLVDARSWSIRYLVVNTSNWWIGHKMLVSPEWIKDVSWAAGTVNVDLTRAAVQSAPPYDPETQLDRIEEDSMYKHYGRTGYWSGEAAKRVA